MSKGSSGHLWSALGCAHSHSGRVQQPLQLDLYRFTHRVN